MLTVIAAAAVRSSALIAAVWVLLKVSRIRDPSAEKLAWTVVLVASFAMPLLAWLILAGALWPLEIVPGQVLASMGRLVQGPRASHPLSVVVLIAYFVGVAAFAARLMRGICLGAKLCRGAQRTWAFGVDMDVRLSAEVQGPVSFGSIVLFPACSVSWDTRTVQAVLAHESEHIRNHDGYRLWLALLCRAAFWFNPLVHWLYRRLTILTELTSDAAAVAVLGDGASYLSVLLQVATGTPPVEAAVPMATRSSLPGRIRQILAANERPVELSTRGKVLLGAGAALFGAVISACASREPFVLQPLVRARVIYAPDLNDFYPDASRRLHEESRGVVDICIDARGGVASAVVRSSTGYATLDAAMLQIAKAYRFKPATRAGKPVRMCTGLPVRFVLRKRAGV